MTDIGGNLTYKVLTSIKTKKTSINMGVEGTCYESCINLGSYVTKLTTYVSRRKGRLKGVVRYVCVLYLIIYSTTNLWTIIHLTLDISTHPLVSFTSPRSNLKCLGFYRFKERTESSQVLHKSLRPCLDPYPDPTQSGPSQKSRRSLGYVFIDYYYS